MVWYIVTFIAGMMFGAVSLIFALAILNNNKIDETENDDDVFNQDGTPKHITFNKNDV